MDEPLVRGKTGGMTVCDVIEQARQQATKAGQLDEKVTKVLICCGCLGDRSDDINEIVECDGCGVTVHEGKYFWSVLNARDYRSLIISHFTQAATVCRTLRASRAQTRFVSPLHGSAKLVARAWTILRANSARIKEEFSKRLTSGSGFISSALYTYPALRLER